MRVRHNRMQHRVFVWVYMNIHVTQHKCLRSVASHRRSPQDPAEVHRLSLCSWYVQHSQEFHTRVQYMCNSKVGIPKSWLHWPPVLYPAPCHPPFAPSFGGAQGLGTAPEYTCCKNVTNVACVSQHYRPIARIVECETSRPHKLCSGRFHSPSAHFWVTHGFFERRIFDHFRGDKLNGSHPYHRSGRYQKGQPEKEKRLAHDRIRTDVTGVARLRPCLVTTKPRRFEYLIRYWKIRGLAVINQERKRATLVMLVRFWSCASRFYFS